MSHGIVNQTLESFTMDKFLNKRYKSERHENLDAILIEMGEIFN